MLSLSSDQNMHEWVRGMLKRLRSSITVGRTFDEPCQSDAAVLFVCR